MKIIRVFPQQTQATPTDEGVVINREPGLFDEADQVHISVAFTWDIPRAEYLYNAWKYVGTIKMGGPAFNEVGGEFEPEMYLKKGYVITSRGCPNKCWFCQVWKRENGIKELKINEGYNLLDDNLLACSEKHIKEVFTMLRMQKEPILFTGGIEAKLLKEWHVDWLNMLRIKRIYCAYDTPDDYEPLVEAGKLLNRINITMENRKAACYVLIGYPNDTMDKALKRIHQTIAAGFFPFAMLWRNSNGHYDQEWKQFQRLWANAVITATSIKNIA
jgi:hypothetical protein